MTSSERLEGPPPSDYIKSNSRIWFSYLPNLNTFNVGLLGVGEASISGILQLRSTFRRPLILNSIKIKFIGEETKGWTKPNNNDYEDKGNFKNICDIDIGLWENESKEVVKWDLPFNIPLPDNLPPSMTYLGKNNNELFVRYKLLALIYHKFRNPWSPEIHTATTTSSVKINLIRYHLPPAINSPVRLSGNTPRYFGYDIHLNKTIFNLGETIKISMKLLLHKVKLKEINILLKEYFIYETSIYNKDKSYSIVTRVVNGDEVHNSLNGNEWNDDILLSLPSGQNGNKLLLCDINKKGTKEIVKIKHKIKFKINMSKNLFGEATEIRLEKRILIGNFVETDLPLFHSEVK